METINCSPGELDKFNRLSATWWDECGPLSTLHKINPLRLAFMQQQVPLANKNIVDVGCGGGILSESMAKLGANVTGIDLAAEALAIAKLHQQESGVNINYQQVAVETFADNNEASFEVLSCMELLEHVPNPEQTINACAQLVKPGGNVFFSTLNRSVKSYLQAVVGAEYILNLLPKGTHDFAKFIKPSELSRWAQAAGLSLINIVGITYNPITKHFKLNDNIDVNYIMHCQKE